MVVVFGLVLGVIKMTESDTVSEVDVAKARAEFIADIYATRVTKGSLADRDWETTTIQGRHL